jgi:hypothetical protein
MKQEGRAWNNPKELLGTLRRGFFWFDEEGHHAALQQARFVSFHYFFALFPILEFSI